MCHATSTAARRLGVAALWAAGFLVSGAVRADESPDILSDSFHVALGGFAFKSDTQIEVDGDTQQGTNVNWENTFGGGDLTRFRLDGFWRFGDTDRHKVRFMWFNSSRSNTRTLERDIEWGDQVYPIGAKTTGEFKFDIYEVAYEYAFLRKDTWELSASAGLHWASLSTSLKARAADSNGTLLFDQHKEASVDAPLPVFGLRGLWQLPHHFNLDAQAQYFALSIDQYDGHVSDYKFVATWQPKTWLGIGLGYNSFGVKVDVNTSNFDGSLNWKYRGPMLFYSASF